MRTPVFRCSRLVVRTLSYMGVLGAAFTAHAQAPPGGLIDPLLRAHRGLVQDGPRLGPSIWPGYRPDTIPVLFVLKEGTLLTGWTGGPPPGMTPLASGDGAFWKPTGNVAAASTSIELGGRGVAQVVVGSEDVPALRGLAAHEAFHVFEGSMRREGRRFGRGENSFLVTRYPVFDAGNEGPYLLEAALLRDALLSRDPEAARARAQEFVAVREARQRRLDADLAEFEVLGELNEGLAEYALLRAKVGSGASAIEEIGRRLARMGNDVTQSIRLRFYTTGPAMAYLLDRIAGDGWKERLVTENLSLQESLAEAAGYRREESARIARGRSRHAAKRFDDTARSNVEALEAARRAQMDSALGKPGVRMVVEAGRLRVGLCGIDPQNLLQVSPGVFLHTRWVRLCAGKRIDGEFTAPAVENRNENVWQAVIGAAEKVVVTAEGATLVLGDGEKRDHVADLTIEAPGATMTFTDVAVERVGDEIRIRFPTR